MDFSRNSSGVMSIANSARALAVEARPKQWVKNLIIFLALFFTVGEAWSPSNPGAAAGIFLKTALAFAIFSALTSAVYLVNDILDVEKDRQHPRKRFRPIAAGQLPIPVAWICALALLVVSLGSAYWLEPLFGGVSIAYFAAMAAYSLILKKIVLLDVFTISTGFVLRAVAGAVVIGVPISPWLYLCTGLAALLLGLAKRRSELSSAGSDASKQRSTLQYYTTELLDQLITILAASAVLAYSFYTFSAQNLPDNGAMMLTIPFIVYGLFRYMYIVRVKNIGENFEDMLTDMPLVISLGLWLASAAVILAIFR
jgi:4-hydroxybenzoate polyprenyltransferase